MTLQKNVLIAALKVAGYGAIRLSYYLAHPRPYTLTALALDSGMVVFFIGLWVVTPLALRRYKRWQ